VPDDQPVVFAQALASAQIGWSGLMQAKQAGDPAQEKQPQQDVGAETAVGDGQVAGFELIEQSVQQAQLVVVLVAFGVIEQDPGPQAEQSDEL